MKTKLEAGRGRGLLVLLAAFGMAAAGVAAAVWWSGRPPEGPVAVAWDRTRCERCGMLVSEPGFAAQLHRSDGQVLVFDDPGCLLLHLEEADGSVRDAKLGSPTREGHPGVHALWFHDHDEPVWVSGGQVVFERVATSPMGYGLAAHERGDLEGRGIDLETARRQALARERDRVPDAEAPR